MGLRDHIYPINIIVELDKGFFESIDTKKEKEDFSKLPFRPAHNQRSLQVWVPGQLKTWLSPSVLQSQKYVDEWLLPHTQCLLF
jgi:hypothetical protein